VQNGGRFRLGSAICIVGVFPFGHRAPLAARIFHPLCYLRYLLFNFSFAQESRPLPIPGSEMQEPEPSQ
jgi:hypothetical protein